MKFRIKTRLYEPARDGITQSLLEVKRECEVKMRYILNGYYLPSNSEAIIFGSAFHLGLEEVSKAIKNEDVGDDETLKRFLALRGRGLLKKLTDEYKRENTFIKEIVENQINKTLIMLPWYFRFWKDDFHTKWAALEKESSFEISGMKFRMKRDAEYFLEEEDGKRIWLFETKTKSRYNVDTIMMWLNMQLQINAYLWSVGEDYDEILPSGVKYNIVRNPGIKKTKRKSWADYKDELSLDLQVRPEFYFQRIERAIPFLNVRNYIKKLEFELHKFQEWYNGDPALDMPCGASCESKYGKCIFLTACASGGKDLSYLEKRTDLFPELNFNK